MDLGTVTALLFAVLLGIAIRRFEEGESIRPVLMFFGVIAVIIIGKIVRAE